MIKKLFTILLAGILLLSAVSGLAEQVASGWRKAALFVPGSAMPEGMEDQSGEMVFRFVDERKGISYEVRVDQSGKVFHQRLMTAYALTGSDRIGLPVLTVRENIRDKHPDAKIEGIYTSVIDDAHYFVSVFVDPGQGCFFRDQFNAATGETVVSLMKPFDEDYVKARDIAMEHLLGGLMLDFARADIGGSTLWFVSVFLNDVEHRLTIDADTGSIIGDSPIASELTLVYDPHFEGDEQDREGFDIADEGDEGKTPPPEVSARPATTPKPTKKPAPRQTRRPTNRPSDDDDDDDDDDD